MSKEEDDFYKSFKITHPKRKTFEIGQTVKFIEEHPWSDHIGEIVRFEKTPWGERPVVRIFDSCDHECFIINNEEAKIIDG